jgi:hypothetical protein
VREAPPQSEDVTYKKKLFQDFDLLGVSCFSVECGLHGLDLTHSIQRNPQKTKADTLLPDQRIYRPK